jgi:hypothetical protein
LEQCLNLELIRLWMRPWTKLTCVLWQRLPVATTTRTGELVLNIRFHHCRVVHAGSRLLWRISFETATTPTTILPFGKSFRLNTGVYWHRAFVGTHECENHCSTNARARHREDAARSVKIILRELLMNDENSGNSGFIGQIISIRLRCHNFGRDQDASLHIHRIYAPTLICITEDYAS